MGTCVCQPDLDKPSPLESPWQAQGVAMVAKSKFIPKLLPSRPGTWVTFLSWVILQLDMSFLPHQRQLPPRDAFNLGHDGGRSIRLVLYFPFSWGMLGTSLRLATHYRLLFFRQFFSHCICQTLLSFLLFFSMADQYSRTWILMLDKLLNQPHSRLFLLQDTKRPSKAAGWCMVKWH